MMHRIIRNIDTISALNKLVDNGFYKGSVNSDNFKLLRNDFPVNHVVVGKIDTEGQFKVNSELQSPMNTMGRFVLGVFAILSLGYLILGNWFMSIIGILLCLTMVACNRVGSRKELRLFMDKYLKYKEKEFHERKELEITSDSTYK